MNKLEDYCFISSGGTPSRSNNKYFGGDILWATISDIEKSERIIKDTKEKITEEGLLSIGNKLFPKGTLLLSIYGSVGKTAIAGEKISINQAILGIIQKKENEIYLPYLSYWFNKNIHILQHKARGGILKNISSHIVKNLEINLPSYREQIEIATVLSKIEKLVKERKESIALLDELIISKFLNMFGDPVINEKEWKLTTCIEAAECIVPNRNKPKSFSGNIKWITTENLIDKGFVKTNEIKLGLTEDEIFDVGAKIIPKNSVIFSCVGDLGKISIIDDDVVMNQQLHSFQCNENLNNIFLMFNISFQKNYMYKYASTTTLPYMNKTTCNNLPLILPPKILQDKFAKIVIKIEKIKEIYKKSLTESNDFFTLILEKLINREIDLNNLETVNIKINAIESKSFGNFIKNHTKEVKRLKVQQYSSNFTNIEVIAGWIKEEFKNQYFTFEILIKFLIEEKKLIPFYFTSKELKENRRIDISQDIKNIVFQFIDNDNEFLKLEQVFYNAIDENFKLTMRPEDAKLMSKNSKEENSGIYLKVTV